MRITKKLLSETKRGMQHRIAELCRLAESPGIYKEYDRCFPSTDGTTPALSEFECLRQLLAYLVELSIPSHWCE